MKNLQRHYRYLTKTKFAASDVIRETLCQRLLLVEYFELKITDNQSDDYLRILSKNNLLFPEKIFGSRISLTYENLTNILRIFENRAPGLLSA